MTIRIKLNNFLQFILRRKIVLLASMLVVSLFFLGIENNNLKEAEKQQSYTHSPVTKLFMSEFSVLIEHDKKVDDARIVQTVKTSLLSDDALKIYGRTDGEELANKIVVFTRGKTGEYVYVRVASTDKTEVSDLITKMFSIVNERKTPFFKGKNIFIYHHPNEPTTVFPNYQDYYNSTDSNLFKQNENKQAEEYHANYARSLVLGLIVGLILGIVLSLFIDLIDKKVHSASSIRTFFDDEVCIYDGVNADRTVILTHLNVYLANAGHSLLTVMEQSSDCVNRWAAEKTADEVSLTSSVSAENIGFSNTALLIVNKDRTTTKWLKEQYELLATSHKQTIIVLINEK